MKNTFGVRRSSQKLNPKGSRWGEEEETSGGVGDRQQRTTRTDWYGLGLFKIMWILIHFNPVSENNIYLLVILVWTWAPPAGLEEG